MALHRCAVKLADFAKSDNMILKKTAFRPTNRPFKPSV
jgi:hypothetical protein